VLVLVVVILTRRVFESLSMPLPSTHRPISLCCRRDLVVRAADGGRPNEVVVKDPINLQYVRLSPLQFCVMRSLDGRRSLHEIHESVQHTEIAAARPALADLLPVIVDLSRQGLLSSLRVGLTPTLQEQRRQDWRRRVLAALSNPLFIRLPDVAPRGWFHWLARGLGWIYSPAALTVSALLLLSSWCYLLSRAEFAGPLVPAFSALWAPASLLWLWLIVGLLKVVHEISHGVACETFGAECQSVGLAFLFFSPCLYCDVTDAWLIERKWHRVMVSLAGIYAELWIATVCLWLWQFSAPGMLHQICWQIFLAGTLQTVLVNANPLLRYDAYYALSDWLEIPNLQQRGRQAAAQAVAWLLRGTHARSAAPPADIRTQAFLLAYGIGSIAFQVPLLLGIGAFLYAGLASVGLQILAVSYFAFLGCRAVARGGAWMLKTFKEANGVAMTAARLAVVGLCIGTAAVGLWNCPIPGTFQSPLVIEPAGVQQVYALSPGRVVCVHARPGDDVEAGEILAELENPELEQAVIAWDGVLAAHRTEFRTAQANRDSDGAVIAAARVDSAREQVEQALAEKERLTIRAPIAGRIISPPPTEGARLDPSAAWTAAASIVEDEALVGRVLRRGEVLVEIAPDNGWRANAWIDQQGIPFLGLGQSVDVRLDAFPHETVPAIVTAIGTADEVPPTKRATSGEDAGPCYHVALSLKHSMLPLQPGMQGRGRFVRPRQSVGQWLTEEHYRLFVAR
jgi:putative peptide zinc metalloprotease protein